MGRGAPSPLRTASTLLISLFLSGPLAMFRRLTTRIVLIPLCLGGVAAILVAADWWFGFPEGRTMHYVGREKCAECHQEQMEQWTGSDHDRAMDLATPETVLGDFNDRQFTHAGVTSTMSRRGDKFLVETDGPTGEMTTFEVKYVFGVRPLQQYMVEFPEAVKLLDGSTMPAGSVQCLPLAWDTEGGRWFHLYPDEEKLPAGDQLHWTGALQNWNYMCAECHSTNLKKNHDVESHAYDTTWSEIDVSCETCHGPGGLHVELAESKSLFWDRRYGFGLVNLKGENPRAEIETCAPCHSRRRIVYPANRDGEVFTQEAPEFLDYYLPELLDRELYYADGQILDEDYVYGSFLQSRMYREKVRCSDCHDPHTARVKFTDNRLCGQCHTPTSKYDDPSHHHHPDPSKTRTTRVGTERSGTECVECHMPETHYMVVDPRRDHSIRVPRPDLTVSLGIPNACNGCHNDESKGETPQWAAEKVEEWYGPKPKGTPPHFAYAIAAGRKHDPQGIKPLGALMKRTDTSAVVRASALLLLADYPPDNTEAAQMAESAAFRVLKNDEEDALVRVAAVRALENARPDEWAAYQQIRVVRDQVRLFESSDDPGQRERLMETLRGTPRELIRIAQSKDDVLARFDGLRRIRDRLSMLLGDEIRAVRCEAARVLSGLGSDAIARADIDAFQAALDEYLTAQRAVDDRPEAHINMALIHDNLNRPDQTEAAYLTAIRLRPQSVAARNNLALFYDTGGQTDKAVAQLREIIKIEPEWPQAHYSLGLALAADEKRLAEAVECFTKASQLDPNRPRLHYNRGLALQRLGKPEEAEQALLTARNLNLRDPDYPRALAILNVQQEQWKRAEMFARAVLEVAPGDRQATALLQELQSRPQGEEEPVPEKR